MKTKQASGSIERHNRKAMPSSNGARWISMPTRNCCRNSTKKCQWFVLTDERPSNNKWSEDSFFGSLRGEFNC